MWEEHNTFLVIDSTLMKYYGDYTAEEAAGCQMEGKGACLVPPEASYTIIRRKS